MRIEKVVEFISKEIKKDIQEEEKRYGKIDVDNMKDYLQEIRYGMTSAEFKEEILWMLTKHDNELYENGIYDRNEYFLANDDVEICEEDGTIYTYRQLMSRVRKNAFKSGEEEGE